MFGSNKKNKETARANNMLPQSSTGGLNSLVKGTSLEGNITAESDFRVDGHIKGTLTCKAKVIIGPTGNVDGEIRCQSAMIEGNFTGKIIVSELLNVRETAKINGEVKTNKLIVQSGAEFNVTCVMGNQKPVAAPSASRNGSVVSKEKKETRATAKAAV